MFEFFTKVKQMTGLDETNQQNDIPNVQALGNAMSTAIRKFAHCNQLKNDNSFISEKIREIKEQGVRFQSCANESINQSDKLSKYAEEVVVFAVACADPSFTKEELLEFLKITLEDARKNKSDMENLQASISGVMADLTNIQNECAQYSIDIQNDARMINSQVANDLRSRELRQRICNTSSKIGTGAAIVAVIAAPITGGASLAIEPLIVAGTTGAISLGLRFVSNMENNNIVALNRRLITERDELNSRIALLNNDLSSIIHESCDILNFWDEQITSINELIEKLERYDNQEDERPSRLVTLTIRRKWNNVSRDCKEYNRIMRAALQASNMNSWEIELTQVQAISN